MPSFLPARLRRLSSSALLALAVALSLLLHLALLWWVNGPGAAGQSAADRQPLSIKLSPAANAQAPDTQRLAEANRQGAGNTEQAGLLASHSEDDDPTPAAPQTEQQQADAEFHTELLTQAAAATHVPVPDEAQQQSGSQAQAASDKIVLQGDRDIVDRQRESGKPGAAAEDSARASPWARYQSEWRQRVERVGNINYPEAARRAGLHGIAVLEVTIAADGSLLSQRLLQSSGHAELDQAARHTVEQSAPFAPFPPELAAHFSQQRITQRFVFTRR